MSKTYAVAAAVLLATLVGVLSSARASTPAAHAVTVPSTPGQTLTVTWTGTILPGANPTSDCSGTPDPLRDHHGIQLTVPANLYSTVRAEFTFKIVWDAGSANDEILTVNGPTGSIGSSDGGDPSEEVFAVNLQSGTYDAIACAFASPTPEPYTGTLTIVTKNPAASVPSADPQGLEFSAAIAADPQRDEAEPLIEIDRAGKIYTCGPTGFSNGADYAQVSTDFGDQFHLLGTPPRGQQGSFGGGDCGLATGITKNPNNEYQYSYSGLGPLTGFTTATSPDGGHTLVTGGPQAAGVTSQGGGADRQWQTFVDATTVLIIYNQQAPRNVVVQRSTDGGLTFSPLAPIAAPDPRFPGPIKYNENFTLGGAQGLVYFPWEGDGNSLNLSISKDKGTTWFSCKIGDAIGDMSFFAVADHDNQGNLYVAYTDGGDRHTYLVTLPVADIPKCNHPAASGQPTNNPGASSPLQVDRNSVRSTVFAWLAAGGLPGRAAVTFYGTATEGNPDLGSFKATWHVYVNQTLNALDLTNRTFSQVKGTTHPFHFDSICLGGLGCDLSVPPGDRSLADFFAIGYNRIDGKLSVVFNRGNKKPDEAAGHVATPMVTTQIAGPSNGGSTLTADANHVVVRSSSNDATGDALARYSTLSAPPPPAPPAPVNEPAMDFTQASIGPQLTFPAGTQVPDGGFTVTMKVANLSNAMLNQALTDTGSQSLLWVWRFTNGYQDAALSARWNPAQQFTFGFNDYTVGSAPCEPGAPAASEKCVLFPGGTAVEGKVDQATGTIQVSVPRSLLRRLTGDEGHLQRPFEATASPGSRFYDGAAFSLGNTTSAVQTAQSFLYPFDNTPAMDFLLPGTPTRVTLRTFSATRARGSVVVRWRTGAESGTLGFNVLRGTKAHRVKLNSRLIRTSGTASGRSYSWRDAAPGKRPRYWLEAVQLNGKRTTFGPVSPR